MKKTLILTLALVFVLSIGSAAFAAANPFVDVPAKHWAYDAVSKLAQAGIVDGYNDGTFRGDKTMTRYEMAQIVAKALAKSDKASAENKALVDKLAVEFAAELQNLGVRVAKLEANQSNLKFSGQLDMRYKTLDYNEANKVSATGEDYRLRLNGTAVVDEKTSFGIRFTTLGQNNADLRNASWRGSGSSTTSNAAIDRVFVNTKLGVVDTTVGRQALVVDPYSIIVDSGFFSTDAVKFSTKSNDFTFTGQYGRVAKGVTNYGGINLAALAITPDAHNYTLPANVDVTSFDVASKSGKLAYDLGVAQFKDNVSNPKTTYLNYYFGNVGYKFDNKWFLGAEYGKNKQDNGDIDGGKFYSVKAVYGYLAPAAKGQSNLTVQYSKMDQNAISDAFTTLDTPWRTSGNNAAGNAVTNPTDSYLFDAFKVFDVNYNYAFSKNFLGQLQYVKVTDSDNDAANYNYFKATLTAKF